MNQQSTEIFTTNNSDNLGLTDIKLDNVPDDILFPHEFIQYLKGQIDFLTLSNARLVQELGAKEEEVNDIQSKTLDLNNKISQYEIITKEISGQPISTSSTRLLSTKIVELSKKLREKNSELETLKTKFSKLQQKITFLENSKPLTEEISSNASIETVKIDTGQEQIKALQDKLNSVNNKLFESKNQNLQLKNDLKSANKILNQELGDNFISIQSYTSNNIGNWRGRAQQILNLQQKNAELQEKLNICSDKDAQITNSTPKIDNRKQIIEKLTKELAASKNQMQECRKKLNAAQARIKVLETECFSWKSKLTNQTEKVQNDEQLIKLLKQQVKSLEDNQNNILKENQVMWETQNKQYNVELSKERCKLENTKKLLIEKESKITDMKSELQSIKNNTFHNSETSVNTKETNTKLNILEVEVQRLMELTAVLNARLESERTLHAETQVNHRKDRQKAAKLETKLLRLEMENNMYKSQIYSKGGSKTTTSMVSDDNSSVAIEGVKNSLELAEENIKALEARLIILQREKDMDFQRFSAILNDTKNIIKKQDYEDMLK